MHITAIESMARASRILSSLAFLLNCGYHRMDRVPGLDSKNVREIRVSIRPFKVNCPTFEYEEDFRQALEARVITTTTWKLVPIHQPAEWVFQGSLESFETHTVGFLGSDRIKGQSDSGYRKGPTPFRSEIRLQASMELRDWETGKLVFKMPNTTFFCQSNMNPHGMNQECIRGVAEKFVDCFFANLAANEFTGHTLASSND
jgi:hypothetical protein